MKKTFFAIFLTCIALAACKTDEPVNEEENKGNQTEEVTPTMEKFYLSGVVKGTDGQSIPNVSIKTGTASTTTDTNGHFSFETIGIVANRSVISFSKDGYFSVSRSGEKAGNTTMEVVMHAKGNSTISSSTEFDVSAGANLAVGDMKVTIASNALKKADGTAYSGKVTADMLYLNPNNEDFSTMMPGGDMAAVRTDKSEATLLSYGMVEVGLTDVNGNALQLQDGEEADMTFPIPAGMENNPPATIPLWYYNDETGLWIEEGIATLKNGVYVGTVSHFSWHNLDVPAERVTLQGTVTDCENRPVGGVKVVVDQTYSYTDVQGKYSVYIPSATAVTVTVPTSAYFNYSPEVSYKVTGQQGGATYTQNVKLPCLPVISGQIVNSCNADSLVFASAYAEYTVSGQTYTTIPVWTTADGKFRIRISGEATTATLYLKTTGGKIFTKNFTCDGHDLNAGVFEVCETITSEYLYLLYDDGSNIAIPFLWNEKTIVAAIDNSLTITTTDQAQTGLNITISGYDATAAMWNGSFFYGGGTSYVSGDNLQIECIEKTNHKMKLALSGNGQSMNTQSTATGAVSISGTLTIPELTVGRVTDWNSIWYLPYGLPTFPTPIDNVGQLCTNGLSATTLEYNTFTKNNLNALQTSLTNASFTLLSTDSTEYISYTYISDSAIIGLTYNATAEIQLEATIAANTSGIGGEGGDGTTKKCWAFTYTVSGVTNTENMWGTEAELKMVIAALEQQGMTNNITYVATDKTEAECENEGGTDDNEQCWEISYSIQGISVSNYMWDTEENIQVFVAAMQQQGYTATYKASGKTESECNAEEY